MTLGTLRHNSHGTPAGVGMAQNPKAWLKYGDIVRIHIDGIGALESKVIEA